MSNFAAITQLGLSAVSQATEQGTLISCRYFIPVYDYRINPAIDPTDENFDENDISTLNPEADTLPTGEIIWNKVGIYSLATTQDFIVSAGDMGFAAGPPDIYNFGKQRVLQPINLFNSVPLSPHISGTAFISPSGTDTVWGVYDSNGVVGINDTTFAKNKLFTTVTYSSTGGTSAGNASFVVKVTDNVGVYKFNKIGLYAVYLDANYEEVGDPFLFSEVIIPQTQIKSNVNGGGLAEVLVEFQIQLSTIAADFATILYGSEADYWTKRSEDGGMLTHDSVYVTKYTTTDDVGVAKTLISTTTFVDGTETTEQNMPQLALQHYDNGADPTTKYRMSFKVTDTGAAEISLSGSQAVDPLLTFLNMGLMTGEDGLHNIGSMNSKWNTGYFKDNIFLGEGWNSSVSGTSLSVSGIEVRYGDIKVISSSTAPKDSFLNGNLAKVQSNLIIRNSMFGSFSYDVFIFPGVRSTNGRNSELISRTTSASSIGAVPWSLLDPSYAGTIIDTSDFLDTDVNGSIYLPAPNGYIWHAGDILPLKPASYDIGSQTKWYNTIYVNALANNYFDAAGNISANDISLTDKIGIMPSENGEGNLGRSNLRYNAVYAEDANFNTLIVNGEATFRQTWQDAPTSGDYGFVRSYDLIQFNDSTDAGDFTSRITNIGPTITQSIGKVEMEHFYTVVGNSMVYFSMIVDITAAGGSYGTGGILIRDIFDTYPTSHSYKLPYIYANPYSDRSCLPIGTCTAVMRRTDGDRWPVGISYKFYSDAADKLPIEVLYWDNSFSGFTNSIWIRFKDPDEAFTLVGGSKYTIFIEGTYRGYLA